MCHGWVDTRAEGDLPLTYHFYVERHPVGTNDWYPLYRGADEGGSFYLAGMCGHLQENVTIKVDIIDQMGATTSAVEQ